MVSKWGPGTEITAVDSYIDVMSSFMNLLRLDLLSSVL